MAQKRTEPVAQGAMPLTFDRPGDASTLAQDYYRSLLIKMQYLDSTKADTKVTYFGETYDYPISISSISHLGRDENGELFLTKVARAAKEVNILNYVGAVPNNELAEIVETGAKVIKTVKPFADRDNVFDEIEAAEKLGCVAIAMDIDHNYFFGNHFYGEVDGLPMGDVSTEDLRSFVAATKLPFVVKGILCVEDALKAVEVGAKGIFLSHHHGMFPYTTPPAMMLPEIVEAVKRTGKDVEVYIDGNITDGYDVFKALALGAHNASIGRPIIHQVFNGGEEAVKQYLIKTGEVLRGIMSRSCCLKVDDIDLTRIVKHEHRF